jgi:cytoskeletal protein RodZ
MSEDQPTVGQHLADARRAAGLSVDEVSARTRIRSTVVKAIEADEFGLSGGDIYARGHIRAIAAAVGIDAKPLIETFDEERKPHGPDVTEVFEHETSGRPMARRGPNWTAVMAAALVGAVLLVGYQVVQSAGAPPRQRVSVSEQTATPVETVTPTPSATPTDSAVAQARGQVVLTLAVLPGKRSWVSVSNPDGEIFQGTIVSGQRKTFRDRKRLSVVVGDAAAIDLTVNGTDVGVMGSNGQVVSQSFGPNDPVGSSG